MKPDDPLSFSPMGRHIAKLNCFAYFDKLKDKQSNLILVTAITPTPAEGKTTTSVGLFDGLNKIGKNSAIRVLEPSPRSIILV